jgi:hypothetical protein
VVNRLRRLHRQRGAVAVEFALVLPLLLLLVLGGIDWGYYFFVGEIAANAAREGARAAALVRTGVDPCAGAPGALPTPILGGQTVSANYMRAGALIGDPLIDTRLRPFDCTNESCGGTNVSNSCCQLTNIPGYPDPVIKVTVAYEARHCTMSLTGFLPAALLPRRVVATAIMRREP